MNPESKRILDVFRSRNLRMGDFVGFTEFGDAIVWESGSVRDEPVGAALQFLIKNGFVNEMAAGLELTQAGENHLYQEH